MSLKPLLKSQEEVIDVLAHIYVVSEIDRNVEGMVGFAKHYETTTLTPKQRQIFDRFKERIPEIRQDMLQMLMKDDG